MHVPLVDLLDICGEDTSLEISTPGSEEDIVGVPVDGQHGGPDGLLQLLCDPPVVLFIERADGDSTTIEY